VRGHGVTMENRQSIEQSTRAASLPVSPHCERTLATLPDTWMPSRQLSNATRLRRVGPRARSDRPTTGPR
jgi:hypothetical protein